MVETVAILNQRMQQIPMRTRLKWIIGTVLVLNGLLAWQTYSLLGSVRVTAIAMVVAVAAQVRCIVPIVLEGLDKYVALKLRGPDQKPPEKE